MIDDHVTKYLGFLCRLTNFFEDVVDDAFCDTLFISSIDPYSQEIPNTIEVYPLNCKYDPMDSIKLFSEQWDLDNIVFTIGFSASMPYTKLYDIVKTVYTHTLHYRMKEYSLKSIRDRREYFLALLFNGKAFVVEGGVDRVIIPHIRHCISAHTHPSTIPYPSKHDVETIIRLLIDRGLLHAIETIGNSLYIYRVGAISEDGLIALRRIEGLSDLNEIMKVVKSIDNLEIAIV